MNPGVHAAIAAAHKKKEEKEEEERLTNYAINELNDGWEFKIVRSELGAFRKPENFQRLLDEGAEDVDDAAAYRERPGIFDQPHIRVAAAGQDFAKLAVWAGKVKVRFDVMRKGSVQAIRVVENTTGHAGVERCVTRVVSGIRFPSRRSGKPLSFTFPFIFAPQ